MDHDARLDPVRMALGQPTFEVGRALLYRGDALELLRQLPDGCVQLVLTSPPYNIRKSYEPRWLAVEEYLGWCRLWLQELHRVCAADAACWINLGYTAVPGSGLAVPIAYLLWPFAPFHLV
jgi:adenine-specific DNA-methyltransferase